MMESLAELYWEEGKFVESTRVYKKVIAQNIDSPRICEWQNKIVRNTLSSGNKRDQVQEIGRLGAVHDKVGEMKPEGKYVKEAAYAAVLAWKNALNVDDHEQKELVEKDREQQAKKAEKNKVEPMAIPEYQKKMIGAFDTYIKYVPDAPELV